MVLQNVTVSPRLRPTHPVARAERERPRTGSLQASAGCEGCALKRACLARDLPESQNDVFAQLAVSRRRIARGAYLTHAGDALHALYVVRSGAFKMVRGSRAGTEKVTGFRLSGDLIGLDAISRGEHLQDVAALEESEVCALPFAQLQRFSSSVPALQRELFRALSADIDRDDGLVLLLGGISAEQRLAGFLLSLSRRYARLGYSGARFVLRMTREDIASYLGLTLETVSRSLSRFRETGLIGVKQREVELNDTVALSELFGFTCAEPAPLHS
jgi:CRP/FNR family transcriptional regulator, anaerobic regulatory protein